MSTERLPSLPGSQEVTLALPSGRTRCVFWGEPWQLGTAAFWVELARGCEAPHSYRLGENLVEEVAACILGGYGIPASVGLAAFERIRERGLLEAEPGVDPLRRALEEPLVVGGRPLRYRFARQRAHRLCAAVSYIRSGDAPHDAVELRDWLVRAPGIGPKTASWVVRNYLSSDEVAIIDVHVRRAGVAAGIFDETWRVATQYGEFEGAFVEWARLGSVSAALLDACIWATLSASTATARDVLGGRAGN